MKLQSTIRLKPYFLLVAPFLNVVFLLLIFFLLNSDLVLQPGVAVQLPQANSLLRPLSDPDFVSLPQSDPQKLFFNREETTWEELVGKIRHSASKSRMVIINADALTPYGQVMRATDIALNEGRDVSYSTGLATPQQP